MQWISVNFAVPPDNRRVLISALLEWQRVNGDVSSRRYEYIATRYVFKNGKVNWKDIRGSFIIRKGSELKVTHWMPLPPPPESPK